MTLVRNPFFEETTEVSGEVVYGMAHNLRAESFGPFLKAHNLTEIDPGAWYPIRYLMDIFEQMEQDSTSFVALGMSIAEHSIMPEGLEAPSMTDMLLAWNEHYQVNHRGGKVSVVETHKINDEHYILELPANHTYPFDLVYGLLYGFCRKLIPRDVLWTVAYDEHENPHKENAEKVLIHVTWGDAEN